MSCKKIFILFLFLFSVSFFTPNIFAADKTQLDLVAEQADSMKAGQINSARWNYEMITSSQMGIWFMLMGENYPFQEFSDSIKKIFNGTGSTLPKPQIGGAIGQGSNMIATLFTPPTSGIQYIASVKDEILGKPAYAQGFGFKGLEFLLPLWKAARNIVYVLSSIIFVVIGLMIILRVKVSPQAVVTVQSAIPQVVTTLILVTFSYAIAGLIIDLSNVIAGIAFATLFSTQDRSLDQNMFKTLTSPNTIPALGWAMTQVSDWFNSILLYVGIPAPFRFSNLVNPDFNTATMLANRAKPHWFSLFLLSSQISTIVTGVFAGPIVGTISSATTSLVIGVIGALIIPIVLAIMIAIWMIQLYFGLIKVYVTIIFKIIVAPLEIAMGAFPNSKAGFGTWVLDVFANVMVFPIVMIFLVIINILTDAISPGGTVWAPGMLNSGFLFGPIISACVGLAGLALISKLPDMIPQYIFMIKPSPWGQAIGQGMRDPVTYTGNASNAFGFFNKQRQTYYETEKTKKSLILPPITAPASTPFGSPPISGTVPTIPTGP